MQLGPMHTNDSGQLCTNGLGQTAHKVVVNYRRLNPITKANVKLKKFKTLPAAVESGNFALYVPKV